MRKKSSRSKKAHPIAKTILLAISSGLIIILAVYFSYTAICRREGKQEITDTLAFLQLQCVRYDNLVAMQDTRSQMQLLDKAKELRRCISDDESLITEEFLTEYAVLQHLSGIFMITADDQLLISSHTEYADFDDWTDVVTNKNVSSVSDNSRKNFISTDSINGIFYDYAVIATPDYDGILFCFAEQIQSDTDEQQITIENLISGYHLEMEGIIFITNNDMVLSSNDSELQGITITDCSIINTHINEISSGEMSLIQEDGTEYIARRSKYSDYYLYVFFPVNEVYQKRNTALAYSLALWILFWLVIAIIRQSEMHRSNDLKLEFLRRMSHDIRTPINGIRGMIQIGNSYPDNLEKQQECRDKIWDATNFIVDLVNDVLDIGKLDSGEAKLDPKPFDLKELVEGLAAVMENQADDNSITFNYSIEGTHWQLIGCPVEIRRVLTNILSNAFKYNIKNGNVTLSCHELLSEADSKKTKYEFVCSDTGIGMSKDFQKHMFEQFKQEYSTGEMSFHGTGLGLTIVKSLVQHLNGQIRCISETGKGTTFYIILPFEIDTQAAIINAAEAKPTDSGAISDAYCRAEATDDAAIASDSLSKPLKDITILLAEDNELNMEIAEFVLSEAGASIIEAWNGQEAVELFKNSKPDEIDIILMDMMMPVMDGETAAITIRDLNRRDAKEIPIIAMTANTFDSDIEAALEAGMNEHVAKPIDSDQLIKTIKNYVK